MLSFELIVDDDRHLIPPFLVVSVASIDRARAHAERQLGSSPHVRRVEVRQLGRSLFTVGGPPAPNDREACAAR